MCVWGGVYIFISEEGILYKDKVKIHRELAFNQDTEFNTPRSIYKFGLYHSI